MPAGERHWWGDYLALSVIGAAFVNDADLIYGVGVAVGDQLVIFSEQALSGSEAAELVAGVEAETVHGVIALFAGEWSWLGAGARRLSAKLSDWLHQLGPPGHHEHQVSGD